VKRILILFLFFIATTVFAQKITISGNSGDVKSVAFSPDGKTLAAGLDDKTVKLWRMPDGVLTMTFSGHSDDVNSVAFGPGGRTLASGSSDGTIKLWRVANGSLITTLSGDSEAVTSVAFSPMARHWPLDQLTTLSSSGGCRMEG
jgi:WD40 repeat protein